MNQAETLHRQAMELAETAWQARHRGELDHAHGLLIQALDLERRAAESIAVSMEPSRSILFRSAASLALQCSETREAERLAASGLAGHVPSEIADELRDVLEEANLQRHLELRGVTLAEGELQLSIAGDAIGKGLAPTELFVSRVQGLEKLLLRTAERQAGQPFREKGRARAQVRRLAQVYLSVPRAASFAVTLRLSELSQLDLPGFAPAARVIDEVLDAIEILESKDPSRLSQLIPDSSYRQNFVGLARAIAPDGRDIKQVGLTVQRGDSDRRVVMKRIRAQVLLMLPSEEIDVLEAGERVQVEGTFLFADDRTSKRDEESGLIMLETGRKNIKVRVPHPLMSDIVKPLWGQLVRVSGVKRGNIIELEQVDSISEDS